MKSSKYLLNQEKIENKQSMTLATKKKNIIFIRLRAHFIII